VTLFFIGFVIGFFVGFIAHAGLLVWRDIQRSRVDRIRVAAGERRVSEIKVRRER